MLESVVRPSSAVIVGATGGLGRAFALRIARDGSFDAVHGLSRTGACDVEGVRPAILDVTDEATIRACASEIASGPPVGLVIAATGLLHSASLSPEKSWRQLDAEALVESFRVNAAGPALVAKHFLPLLPRRGKAVFAALSARVGSIADNRLGGWFGYRASKAALNQLIRTLAIELSRSRPDAVCIGMHPGTVDSGLSAPYQSGVRPDRLFTPDQAAGHLLDVMEAAGPAESGSVLAWDGKTVPP